MPDKILWERQLPRNTGFAFEVKRGQSVRITSQTIIDFVCFNGENLRERFDQARTKANQRKVFISTGDLLVSKLKPHAFKRSGNDVFGVGRQPQIIGDDLSDVADQLIARHNAGA